MALRPAICSLDLDSYKKSVEPRFVFTRLIQRLFRSLPVAPVNLGEHVDLNSSIDRELGLMVGDQLVASMKASPSQAIQLMWSPNDSERIAAIRLSFAYHSNEPEVVSSVCELSMMEPSDDVRTVALGFLGAYYGGTRLLGPSVMMAKLVIDDTIGENVRVCAYRQLLRINTPLHKWVSTFMINTVGDIDIKYAARFVKKRHLRLFW